MIEIQVIQTVICMILVVSGIGFILLGSIGILRLPDFYTRLHAVSTSDTIGLILVILGLIVYEGFGQSSFKLLLILLFIALSNPIGTHALARAAFRQGVEPFMNEKPEKENNS